MCFVQNQEKQTSAQSAKWAYVCTHVQCTQLPTQHTAQLQTCEYGNYITEMY
jgi:hypothetical protein